MEPAMPMPMMTNAAPRPCPPPCAPVRSSNARTLLLVEDSHVAAEAVRAMFRHAGGRLRRADCLSDARRHLALYTPDALLVDIGLPDGSGLELIGQCDNLRPRVPLIVAMSGAPDMHDAALQAGADHFVAKPFASIAAFCQLLAPVFGDPRGTGPGARAPAPDAVALRNDLQLACDMLSGSRAGAGQRYALQFTAALARSLGDRVLSRAVDQARQEGCVAALALVLRQRLRNTALI